MVGVMQAEKYTSPVAAKLRLQLVVVICTLHMLCLLHLTLFP